MAEFINCLASSINASSLSPRATTLFNQAMAAGRYRWGRKGKLVAGACLVLALREYKRPDALYDVAHLLGEAPSTLVRTLTSVTAVLGLSFTASDPRVHLPCFQTHLASLLQDGSHQSESSNRNLPSSLMAQLKPLSLHTAVATATSLASLLARFGPDYSINQLPVPPTACALFLLALEADLRTPLDHLGDLAACLGSRYHLKHGTIMARYKLVQEEVLALADQVPWLDKYQSKNGRAKVGKRTVVARGLKDVLLFQDEIWRKRTKPTVVLDISDGENDDYFSEPESENTPSSCKKNVHSKKRRKTSHKPLYDAAQFLLDPLSAPVPPFGFTTPSSVPLQSEGPQATLSASPSPSPPVPCTQACSSLLSRMPITLSTSSYSYPPSPAAQPSTLARLPLLPLTSYLLTAPTSTSLTSRLPPSRLQLLAASRGGEKDITDEELFGEGELERLFRSEGEIESLRKISGWGDWEDETNDAEEGKTRVRKRRRKDVAGDLDEDGEGEIKIKGSKRINLEALTRFLETPTEEKDDQYGYDTAFVGLERFDDEKDDEYDWQDRLFHSHQDGITVVHDSDIMHRPCTPTDTSSGKTTTVQDDGEVVFDEWRPLSPETGRYGGHSGYDEDYD